MDKKDLQISQEKVNAIKNFYLKPPSVVYMNEDDQYHWFYIESQEDINAIYNHYCILDKNFEENNDIFSNFKFKSPVWICIFYDSLYDGYIYDDNVTSFIDEAKEFLKAFNM